MLSQLKLIAEPWDLGEGGYQVGNFPVLWTEWNGRFRDTVRRFWRGDARSIGDLGYRLTGSSDVFAGDGAPPAREHQLRHRARRLHAARSRQLREEAQRGERRGQPRRRPDDNAARTAASRARRTTRASSSARRTLARSLMATLFVSQGVPMLEMGDELWRTQRGNNNAYCHDSELTWVDWRATAARAAMLGAARALVALRKRLGVPSGSATSFAAGAWATGAKTSPGCVRTAREMQLADWKDPPLAAIAFRLEGDPSVLVLLNGEPVPTTFKLRRARRRRRVARRVRRPRGVPGEPGAASACDSRRSPRAA